MRGGHKSEVVVVVVVPVAVVPVVFQRHIRCIHPILEVSLMSLPSQSCLVSVFVNRLCVQHIPLHCTALHC